MKDIERLELIHEAINEAYKIAPSDELDEAGRLTQYFIEKLSDQESVFRCQCPICGNQYKATETLCDKCRTEHEESIKGNV